MSWYRALKKSRLHIPYAEENNFQEDEGNLIRSMFVVPNRREHCPHECWHGDDLGVKGEHVHVWVCDADLARQDQQVEEGEGQECCQHKLPPVPAAVVGTLHTVQVVGVGRGAVSRLALPTQHPCPVQGEATRPLVDAVRVARHFVVDVAHAVREVLVGAVVEAGAEAILARDIVEGEAVAEFD